MAEYEWRRECPKFSGEDKEYKGWKSKVEDWLDMMALGKKEGENKLLGIQIRLSLEGKASEVTECIDREEIRKEDGHKIILKKLDEIYLQDNITENYRLLKKLVNIERKPEESMRDYLIRYDKNDGELNRIKGRIMFDDEIKSVHMLERARLTENQKQMVLSACGSGEIKYKNMCQVMRRIFEGMTKKEESEWLGSERHRNVGPRRDEEGVRHFEENEDSWSGEHRYYNNKRGKENNRSRGRGYRSHGRGGRNPINARGRVSVCAICGSEWHWARDCPKNYTNRKKEDDVEYVEYAYLGESEEVDENRWKEIEAIIDTGCKSTVCGEL